MPKLKKIQPVVQEPDALDSVMAVADVVFDLPQEPVEKPKFKTIDINGKKYKQFRRDDGTTFVEPLN